MNLIITGDIALARGIDQRIKNDDYDILSEDIIGLFKEKDLCLVNLECPLTDSDKPKWVHFPTLKASTKAIKIINDLNVNVASLANNHITDYGDTGLFDTISVLDANGIKWLGAGKTPDEANAPLIIVENECTIGILALAQPEIAAVSFRSAGAGVLEGKRAIKTIRELSGKTDITIAYLHYGAEFYEYPTPPQVSLSRSLIDAGADLVIGHHPHVVQGYEHYKGGFIAYSLGNFIFDMKPTSNKFSRLGMVIDTEIKDKKVKDIQITLVDTANGNTVSLHGDKKKEADNYLKSLCSVLENNDMLIEKYYFTCRDHFKTYLSAFISFLFIKRNMRNCYDWLLQEFWPQNLKMRIDLIKFVFSGQALTFEIKKGPPKEGHTAIMWRGICYIGRMFSFIGGRFFIIK